MNQYLKIIKEQKHPLRFLLSRLLRYSGLWRIAKIQKSGYSLYLHPASLSMSLWVDKNDRCLDSNILKRILREGDVYIDVGANIGHLVIEAAIIVGKSGKVFAFEPHPHTVSFLHQNIQLNKLSNNVRVAQSAVGVNIGWAKFTNKRSDDQNSITDEGDLFVPLINLDAFLEKEYPTLLKIDVEGFEKFVLLGADDTLDRTQFIYFEAWDEHFNKYNYSFMDIFDYLSEKGFRILHVYDDSNSITKVTRDANFPTCTNLFAYRDKKELEKRTGWILE